jgi:integrase
MARGRLSETKIAKLIRAGKNGLHGDGNNLYLQISGGGSGTSWVFRYKVRGTNRVQPMGLGPYRLVSLEEARDVALAYCKLLLAGKDPKRERDDKRLDDLVAQGKAKTVVQAVEVYRKMEIESAKPNTRGPANRYLNMLNEAIGHMPLERVTREVFVDAQFRVDRIPDKTNLKALHEQMPPTAEAYRVRAAQFFAWAINRGWRPPPNPATFEQLQSFLPKVNYKRQHRKEPDWKDMPRIMAKLRAVRWGGMLASYEGRPPLALGLELVALTGVRLSEVRLATWGEFDFERMVWTVPVDHQKDPPDDEPKEIPITTAMLKVLDEAAKVAYPKDQALSHSPRSIQERPRVFAQARHVPNQSPDALVFPNTVGKPFDAAQFARFIRLTLKETFNTHGLRGVVKNWGRIHAPEPHLWEVLWKIQAGQAIGSKNSDQPYGRAKLLDQRRAAYELWGEYLSKPTPEPKAGKVLKPTTGKILKLSDKRRRTA